jgi:hypothetical protein
MRASRSRRARSSVSIVARTDAVGSITTTTMSLGK